MSFIYTLPLAIFTKLLAGLQKNQSTLSSFVLAGTTYTPASCVSAVQALVDSGNSVVTAKGAYQKALEQNRVQIENAKPFLSDLKTALLLAYGNAPDRLSDFGLVPNKKTGPQSTVAKLVAVAKRAATRKVRNTMGPKAKGKLKGTVPSTISVTNGEIDASNGSAPSGTGAASSPSAGTSSPALQAVIAPVSKAQ